VALFLKKLAGFGIILLLVASVLQILIGLRIRNRSVTGHDNLDLANGGDNELVFLGSSRCYTQFDPSLFEKALRIHAANLGVEGHSELPIHFLRLENYLAKNAPPKIAVLNFDPLIFAAGSFDSNGNFVGKDHFARYAFWPSAVNAPIVKYFGFNWFERNVPLYAILRYQLFLDCITLPYDKGWKTHRYNYIDAEWDTLNQPVARQAEGIRRFFFDTGAASTGRIAAQLASLDSLCRAHGIRLVCVQTPIYKAAYDPVRFSYPEKICSALHIPFFDLNNPALDDDVHNFYNIDHLNITGVARMTTALLSFPSFLHLFDAPDSGR
jgi:hypothetical protein